MRNVTLALLTLAGLLAFNQEKAHAEKDYPYCMSHVMGWGTGMVEECMYSTMEQCRAAATGLNGMCDPNWRLQYRSGNPEAPVKHPRSRRQS
ncbi:DUF3551 domain-containing protein [Bradyrhizobium sp. SYSU BS000235]|uniref:DUF3551 domain-containing protein n=1 Tax=Bradyrhizobium sp. SYSU BS000235 TaxID=3411332 RepID=UPI003C791A51